MKSILRCMSQIICLSVLLALFTQCGHSLEQQSAQEGPPTISAVQPSSGDISGNTSVQITGTNFDSQSTVLFGSIQAVSLQVISPTEIIAVSPAVATAGSVSLVVSNSTNSTATNSFQYTSSAVAAGPLTAPSNLSVATVGTTSVTLNWQGNSSGQVGFYFMYSTNASFSPEQSYTVAVTSGPGPLTTQQNFSALSVCYAGSTCYVEVASYTGTPNTSSFQTSSNSNVVTFVVPGTAPGPLVAPTNLAVMSNSGSDVELSWQSNSVGQAGFYFLYSANSSFAPNQAFTVTETGGPTSYDTDQVFTNLLDCYPGSTCYVKVASYTGTPGTSSFQMSSYSNVVTFNLSGNPPGPLVAPSNLSVVSVSSTNLVIQWQSNSVGQAGYYFAYSSDPNFGSYQSFYTPDTITPTYVPTTQPLSALTACTPGSACYVMVMTYTGTPGGSSFQKSGPSNVTNFIW